MMGLSKKEKYWKMSVNLISENLTGSIAVNTASLDRGHKQ